MSDVNEVSQKQHARVKHQCDCSSDRGAIFSTVSLLMDQPLKCQISKSFPQEEQGFVPPASKLPRPAYLGIPFYNFSA